MYDRVISGIDEVCGHFLSCPYNRTNEIDSFIKMSAAPHSVVHATNFVPEEDKKDDNGKGTVSLSGPRVGTATGSGCAIVVGRWSHFPEPG
jgi:hypothetical protein